MSWASVAMMALAFAIIPARRGASARAAEILFADTTTENSVSVPDKPDPLAVAASLDLLGACLRAGLPVSAAITAMASTAPKPMADSLRRVADLLALGADPDAAWSEAALDPDTEALARMARRSARSGSSLSSSMAELAERSRGDAEDLAAAAAERAGVLISGPLGLCFLPAFIALGIVPVVIGLATTVLGNGML
ncbi:MULTISPECIES: type II secretion system F family protein [Rhodococcus]|uniref:type II secretion system F family protein n=1 Tax=Rhodococcus TaxID=1827 RepID=UPI001C248AE8|nr:MULTISPECIES: type II secretion system F family protein [Rhodococcus]MCX6477553.1 type II secretion system F family protein [Rhodococcus sp. (in: high G+C Gram-positive bacteria)]QXC43549.1 type II secretion system F family protein [Rhodococcus qingshengii]